MKQKIKELENRVGKLTTNVSEIIGKMDFYFSQLGNIVKNTTESQQNILNLVGSVKEGIDSELSFLRHSYTADYSCAKHQVLALKSKFDKSVNKILELEKTFLLHSNEIYFLIREQKCKNVRGTNKEFDISSTYLNIIVHGIRVITRNAKEWFINFCQFYLGIQVKIESASFKRTKKFLACNHRHETQKREGKIFGQCHTLKNLNLRPSITDNKWAGRNGTTNKKQKWEKNNHKLPAAFAQVPSSSFKPRKVEIAKIAPSQFNYECTKVTTSH